MKRRFHTLALLAAIGVVLLNVIAYQHVRAMTHFAAAGTRTEPPEHLSLAQKAAVMLMGVTIPRPTNHSTPNAVGLTYTVQRFSSTDGVSLEGWFVSHPDAKGIVAMFHGYAASKSTLLETARAFHELGYAVFLVDFRGSGGSSGSETSIGVREAEDVAAAVAYVRSMLGNQPLILFGQSMGSAAILRAVGVFRRAAGGARVGVSVRCVALDGRQSVRADGSARFPFRTPPRVLGRRPAGIQRVPPLSG